MNAQNLLPLLLLAPACAAIVLGARPQMRRRNAALWAGLALTAALLLALSMASAVLSGEVLRWSADWLPQLGLGLSLRVDALAWLFVMMILGVGVLVVLYAHYYLAPEEPVPRFFAFLLAFASAMLGVVISGNLLLLVVFWELTSLASFLLIGFWRDDADARRGARMALAVTAAGGLALLAGVLLLGNVVGSLELDVVLNSGELLRQDAHYPWILGLILLGAFTKSAQFPFHFWLPHAMAAPTPVSAFLHSATMVKAGVFLLVRLYPALSGTETWLFVVGGVGLTTLLLGAYAAIFQHDLKGLLAYSTISHLGLITLLLGLQSPLTVVAAVFHIVNHATFKASLFMAAGIIDHECGTRDMRRLKGLMRYMPWTGALAIVAAAAMAGVPLLNGFLSKEMFFAESLQLGDHGWLGVLVPIGAVLAGIFGVAYSTRFIHDVFFGTALSELERIPHEPPRWMKVPVEVLVFLCIAVGSFPAWTIGGLLHAAATNAAGQPLPEYSLAIWHGFNLPLAMSVVALIGGLSLYFMLGHRGNLHQSEPSARARGIYDHFLAALYRFASGLGAALDLKLKTQLLVALLVVLVAAGWPQWADIGSIDSALLNNPPWAASLLLVLLLVTVVTLLAKHRNRLLSLLLLGAVGLMVSLVFVLLSAPDLALTQLLVEVASVLLMLLALKHLPAQAPPEDDSVWWRRRDALIAGACGLGVSLLCLGVLSQPSRSISQFFFDHALSGGGGSNVVNVIIVDFRSLDTLGEMTVFAIAAVVIHALLGNPSSAPAVTDRTESEQPLLLRMVASLLLPFAMLIACYLLLRGHNQPGGGFIAGLVAAGAIILQYLAQGSAWVEQRLRWPWLGLLASGLLLAVLTGAAAWLVDYPFLSSYYQYWKLPLLGKIPLASAFLFDLGVFLVVSAGTVLALGAFARAPRMGPEVAWKS
jgi:multicomponent K+:H+ antiporter subunit A